MIKRNEPTILIRIEPWLEFGYTIIITVPENNETSIHNVENLHELSEYLKNSLYNNI